MNLMIVGNHEFWWLQDRKGLLVDVPLRSLHKHKPLDMIFLQLQQLSLPFSAKQGSKIKSREATNVGDIYNFPPIFSRFIKSCPKIPNFLTPQPIPLGLKQGWLTHPILAILRCRQRRPETRKGGLRGLGEGLGLASQPRSSHWIPLRSPVPCGIYTSIESIESIESLEFLESMENFKNL